MNFDTHASTIIEPDMRHIGMIIFLHNSQTQHKTSELWLKILTI
jgi:hypothetical protein